MSSWTNKQAWPLTNRRKWVTVTCVTTLCIADLHSGKVGLVQEMVHLLSQVSGYLCTSMSKDAHALQQCSVASGCIYFDMSFTSIKLHTALLLMFSQSHLTQPLIFPVNVGSIYSHIIMYWSQLSLDESMTCQKWSLEFWQCPNLTLDLLISQVYWLTIIYYAKAAPFQTTPFYQQTHKQTANIKKKRNNKTNTTKNNKT